MMALNQWGSQSQVNVAEIDFQHQEILGLINQLHDAMKRREGREVIGQLLSDLVASTRTHFSTEEKLMSDYGYPEYRRHKADHDKLIEHVVTLERKFQDGDVLVSFAIMLDLQGWAIGHIGSSDRRLAIFLNGKGVF